nr:putative reverse transcriptase domain-containing protein [Tanacetum cinerariifolium]
MAHGLVEGKTFNHWQDGSLNFESLIFEASFIDSLRKLPVDPAFAVDFKSCADIICPELIRDTTEKIVQIKNRLLAARSREKSYADKRAKVSPWKGVVRFRKHRKLRIHSTFHVLNLKKCLAEGDVVIPLDKIQLDDKLHMIEEPVEVVDIEVKRLRQSQIPIVKVR